MNIHKIDSHLHHSFLEEERKDAITGDLIQANDEVVFCASCKSVFLKDSWKFINETHCGQKNTLKEFPIARQLLLNAPVINPVFITPLLSSFSMQEWKEHLSEFDVEDKKAMIYLKSNFIADWQNSQFALPQVQKKSLKKIYREPTQQIAPLSYLKKLKRRIKGQKRRIKNYIDHHRDNKIMFLDSQPFVGYSVFITVFALIITVFPALDPSSEEEISSIVLRSLLILFMCPMLYILYQFIEVSFGHLKQKVASLLSTKSKSLPLLERLNPTVEETNNNNVNILFGIIENKFFLYTQDNRMLSFCFNENEITIFHISDKQISLQLKNQMGEETFFSLIFFSKQKMSKFLLTLAKQKNHFMDKGKVNLIDFPPNKEKYLKKNLRNYTEFTFVKPTPQPNKKESKEYPEKMTMIQLENPLNPIDLTKLEKSQKISKQSQNRNQHHQNKHQTQYRNYKRR